MHVYSTGYLFFVNFTGYLFYFSQGQLDTYFSDQNEKNFGFNTLKTSWPPNLRKLLVFVWHSHPAPVRSSISARPRNRARLNKRFLTVVRGCSMSEVKGIEIIRLILIKEVQDLLSSFELRRRYCYLLKSSGASNASKLYMLIAIILCLSTLRAIIGKNTFK